MTCMWELGTFWACPSTPTPGSAATLGTRIEPETASATNKPPKLEGPTMKQCMIHAVVVLAAAMLTRNTSPVWNGWYGQGRELASGEVGSQG